MHLNIRRQGIFVIDKSVYIIQLDKTICISLETVSSCSVINSSVPSHKNIEVNQSVYGSYHWVSFSTKSVCRFLFRYVLVYGVLLYVLN